MYMPMAWLGPTPDGVDEVAYTCGILGMWMGLVGCCDEKRWDKGGEKWDSENFEGGVGLCLFGGLG